MRIVMGTEEFQAPVEVVLHETLSEQYRLGSDDILHADLEVLVKIFGHLAKSVIEDHQLGKRHNIMHDFMDAVERHFGAVIRQAHFPVV